MNFPKINNLPPYHLSHVAKKVHELRVSGVDVIDLSQLNPSLPPPQFAIDTLVQATLKPHNHKYSASSGIVSLRESVSNYFDWKFNAPIDPHSEVAITSGTKEAIVHLLMSILTPGDSMLVPVPAYPVHTAASALVGVSFIGVPLWKDYDSFKEEGGVLTAESDYFFVRLHNRYFQTWPRPKVILISFPHNPTTTIVTKCFYERLIAFARENNCLVINDFAHGDLYYNSEDNVSILSIADAKKCALELYSISKGFSLAGWRIGSACGNAEAIEALKSLKSYTDFGIFQPLQIAASKLLTHEISTAGEIVYENVQAYKSRRDLVITHLLEMGWDVNVTKASPFIWASVPENVVTRGAKEFCEHILETAHVACFPGVAFDAEQKTTVRISLTENESRLRQAMNRLATMMAVFLCCVLPQMLSAEENCPKALTLVKKAHVSAFSSQEVKEGLIEASKLCPHLVEAVYELGRLYLKEEKYDLAEQKFKEAESIKPKVEHVVGLALSQTLKKDYAAAENTYKQGLTTYLGHWTLLEGLGVLYMDLQKYDESEELLRQALQAESTVDTVYYNLGVVLEKQGKIDDAIVSYKTALSKNPQSIFSAINLAKLLYRSGSIPDAQDIIKKAIFYKPDSAQALLLHVTILTQISATKEAKIELEKISDIKFDEQKKLLLLVIRAKEGACDEIDTESGKLSQGKPSFDFLKALGTALTICKNYEKAETVLQSAFQLNAQDPIVLNNLGTVYEALGRVDRAKEMYLKASNISSYSVLNENAERLK